MKFILRSALTPIQRDITLYALALTAVSYQFLLYYKFESINIELSLYRDSFIFGLISTFFLSSFFMYIYLIVKREKRPLKVYLNYSLLPFKYWNETLNFLFLSISVSIIFSVYTSVKYSIPEIIPFYLDPYLVELDQFIFWGFSAWEITHSIFSTPLATGVINFFYNIWFFIIWIFLISFMCCVKHNQIRKQVILSFLLCWIINGNIAALLFSSAGPCFYDLAYETSSPYTELMHLLKQQNTFLIEQDSLFRVWALTLQDVLWESYTNRTSGIGKGISALPSMHVSMTCLIAIAVYSLNKNWGIFVWLYALIIMIGSVHLGWHYAADGIVAVLLTSAIWYFVKRYTTKTNELK
ncbi:phosphatase PAP2 family protein [Marinomonas gallaica]|uniref:phosphatase PAP2 family protein n=1 Tax=Marinomonas gallaica TaxID=1806667 RepID=UPI003A937A06